MQIPRSPSLSGSDLASRWRAAASLHLSSQLCVQGLHSTSLKWAMVGVFIYTTETGQTLQIRVFCSVLPGFVFQSLLWTI